MKIIDLRSDTVTRPTDKMRNAMATAAVGDDVYGEDPTVNRLQELAAGMAGKEAGVNVVGGDLMKYWSKCIIELQSKSGKKKAIIRKHRSLPEKEFNFEIVDEGVRRRGWL